MTRMYNQIGSYHIPCNQMTSGQKQWLTRVNSYSQDQIIVYTVKVQQNRINAMIDIAIN